MGMYYLLAQLLIWRRNHSKNAFVLVSTQWHADAVRRHTRHLQRKTDQTWIKRGDRLELFSQNHQHQQRTQDTDNKQTDAA